MADKPIRLMMVDASPLLRDAASRFLVADPQIEVAGAFGDLASATQKISEINPNIMALDIEMRDGQYKDSIKAFHQDFPSIRIIILSARPIGIFDALKAGADDFVTKPPGQPPADYTAFLRDLALKIKMVHSVAALAARRASISKPAAQGIGVPTRVPPVKNPAALRPLPGVNLKFPNAQKKVIAIGASTGGTEATVAVVKDLPADTPGIVIVQHMPPVFTKMYAERLDRICRMGAKEAENGDRVQQGLILLAPGGDRQMRLYQDARGYYVKLEPGAKVSGHCPSVDVLFESVANTAGPNAVGVILTGMGGDGAAHLLKMRQAGAYTIGQDEASCVVYGMPMVAYNLGAVVDQLPLDAIAGAMLRYLNK